MLRKLREVLLRRGLQTAVEITTNAAAAATGKTFIQVFNVTPPLTVFVRASHCNVRLRCESGMRVELRASLQASFGWEFVAEQDDAGVYIVARRKPVVGALSAAAFDLLVPPEANVVFHLTPGSVHLADVNGKLVLPAGQVYFNPLAD